MEISRKKPNLNTCCLQFLFFHSPLSLSNKYFISPLCKNQCFQGPLVVSQSCSYLIHQEHLTKLITPSYTKSLCLCDLRQLSSGFLSTSVTAQSCSSLGPSLLFGLWRVSNVSLAQLFIHTLSLLSHSASWFHFPATYWCLHHVVEVLDLNSRNT